MRETSFVTQLGKCAWVNEYPKRAKTSKRKTGRLASSLSISALGNFDDEDRAWLPPGERIAHNARLPLASPA